MLKFVLVILLLGRASEAVRTNNRGDGASSNNRGDNRGETTTVRGEQAPSFPDYRFTPLELALYKQFSSVDTNSITFSPLSIRCLMAMVKEGARGNTRVDLENAVGPTDSIEKVVKASKEGLDMGNAFYLANNLEVNDQYRETLANKYYAEFQYADFSRPRSAAYNINEWVRRITDKGITELVTPEALGQDSVFVLVNAIHLEAKWKRPFDIRSTRDDVFYELHEGGLSRKLAPIMQQHDIFRTGYVASLDAKVIEMPFRMPEKLSMYLVVPKSIDGLQQMVRNLNQESLKEILQSLGNPVELTLSMPRFRITTSKLLRNVLPKSVASIFGASADISGISSDKHLQLSEMIHKADLKVDEEGATGSAATAVHAVLLSNSPNVYFNVSHPFMYFIAKSSEEPRYGGYGRPQRFGENQGPAENLEIFFMGHVTKLSESYDAPDEQRTVSERGAKNPTTGGGRRQQRMN